ncbi:MAG: MFS transporter [Alphaproteobacteria bacterium]|nr:MFS transporter [Alphaproteobacteria bacterium]
MTAIAEPFQLHGAVARYRGARERLRTPGSTQSRHGLDWMNFFIADVQTGFGTFVAFYLARLGWTQELIGIALGVGSIAGVLAQVPGGALADAIGWKRGLAAVGILMVGSAALIFALAPTTVMVFAAEILHGLTAGILTPVIGAISLGIVGRHAMSSRTGRNFRFAAAGHALTAATMGAAGAYLAESAIFLVAAALCLPALIALSFIRPDEIDYTRARNAVGGKAARPHARVLDLLKNRSLVLFAACVVLFQLADASMLPLLGENLARGDGSPAILMSGLIIVPQLVTAVLAPWVGYHSETHGRKPLLLVGFGLEPLRALLLAFSAGYPFALAAQLLDGISGAIITVLTVLVITDLTTGTGRFNLARGTVGALSGIAASVSTLATGFLYQRFGHAIGFLSIAVVATAAVALLWVFQETKPAEYVD